MKKYWKILLLLICSLVFTASAGNKDISVKKDETVKAAERTDSKKKVIKSRSKTENINKWTNWSKIKDLFM